MTTHPTLDGFEPLSPDFLADPASTLARARREQPVFFHEALGYWVVTRYDDIVTALTDWRTFSQNGSAMFPVPDDLRDGGVSEDLLHHTFVTMDPPEHTVVRKAVNKAFTRSRVETLRPVIARLAGQLIDGFDARGECELMDEFCYQLSTRTIVHLLGLPDSDEAILEYKQWADDFIGLITPRTAPGEPPLHTISDSERHERWGRIAGEHEFLRELLAHRRANPADDLMTALLHVTGDDGEPAFSDERIIALMLVLIMGGTDTTAGLMGEITLRLCEHPEFFERVRRDPDLIDTALEEAIRYRGTVMGLFRWTTCDVALSGTVIPAHSRVMLMFQSAGRDEQYFACPHRFDLDRCNAADHLGFGRGRHFCLGSPLARLETRVGLETLYRRLPGLRLDGDVRYVTALTASLLERLPVAWDAAG
jgi:cytochrome P450